MHVKKQELDTFHGKNGDSPGRARDRGFFDELKAIDDEGAEADFAVVPGGRVRCSGCDMVHPAQMMTVLEVRRLEGTSDPEEMSAVIKVRCQHCGTEGALITSYGPSASAEDADVLAALTPEQHAQP